MNIAVVGGGTRCKRLINVIDRHAFEEIDPRIVAVADVFEEKDHTLVVVEMPGISEDDVQIDVKDNLLTLYAEHGEKKYRKEILMPKSYPKEKMRISCNNGILEIKCIL